MTSCYLIAIILHIIFLKVNASLNCYQCNSKTLEICAVEPLKLNNEFISCPYGDCAVTIVDGVTYRGCASELTKKVENIYYKTCKTQLCNNMIYPPGRLKCHQCNGTNCISEQIENPKPCLKFLEGSDQCYVDIINEKTAVRGCKSDDDNVTLYFPQFCNINGCNKQNGIINRTCIECDSNDSIGCKRAKIINSKCSISNLEECTTNYLLGRPTETCFTYHKLNRVKRGCSRLFVEEDKNNNIYFTKCESDFCNNECLNVTQCVVCNTDDRPDCSDQAAEYPLQKCKAEDSACYAHLNITSGNLTRDCGTPKSLMNSYQCQNNGCNSKSFRYCYECNSEINPECAQWQNKEGIPKKICESPDSECVTLINAKQHTIRGCKSLNLNCYGIGQCRNCTGNLCNSDIFPEKRLKCYQCKNTDECSTLTKIELKPCLLYDKNDLCHEYANSKNQMVRDCKSNINEYKKCKDEDYKCLVCSKEGCNNHKVFYETNLICHSCYDDSENLNFCGWTQINKTNVKCQSPTIFYSKPTCFSKRFFNGSLERGCSWDKNMCYPEITDENCELCSENNCNRRNYLVQTCIQCQSNNTGQISCGHHADGIKPNLCKNSKHYYENRGCYTKIEANNVVIRGCAADLSESEFVNCQQIENKICNYCTGSDCNIMRAPVYFATGGKQKRKFNFINLIYIFGVKLLYF